MKRKNLIRLGVEQGQAYAWSRSGMGGWVVAQSPILRTTITVKRLKIHGYISIHFLFALLMRFSSLKKMISRNSVNYLFLFHYFINYVQI